MKLVLFALFIFFTCPTFLLAPERQIDWFSHIKQNQQFIQEQRHKERIKTLLQVIRIIESNDRYDARGLSGEYGAYQFMPGTWDIYCYSFFGKRLNMKDPENQDKVAWAKVSHYVDQGYNDMEIAAIWNSGSASGWRNKVGINSRGIPYNVPAYVDTFISLVQQL